MTLRDHRHYPVTGANPEALDAYERAIATFQSWRSGTQTHLDQALAVAPGFTMAHALNAYVGLCSRDPARVRAARSAYFLVRERLQNANGREQGHLRAIEAALSDDYQLAAITLGELLRHFPRDILALQVAHAFDYSMGNAERMANRVSEVMPAWEGDLPGRHAVLAMRAFSLVESGDFQQGADTGRQALALNPHDARAHHAVAHAYEMTEQAAGGVKWMHERLAFWEGDSMVAVHCWWHLALFHLAQGEYDRSLTIYDTRIRSTPSPEIADMIDASALLWRIELAGASAGKRWLELSAAWKAHIGDGFCSFNDLHAMLAFVGARDWVSASRLEHELLQRGQQHTRHGETTRLIGLPACRALIAFGHGKFEDCIEWLGKVPREIRRIGGSHAQRDVLNLTLMTAIERIRRPHWQIAA
jgi:tetratricopeptide (TPR) repeat protein